jgi:hypothetical protein
LQQKQLAQRTIDRRRAPPTTAIIIIVVGLSEGPLVDVDDPDVEDPPGDEVSGGDEPLWKKGVSSPLHGKINTILKGIWWK